MMLATKIKAVPAQGSPASPSPAASVSAKAPASGAGAGGAANLDVAGYASSAIFKSLHSGMQLSCFSASQKEEDQQVE